MSTNDPDYTIPTRRIFIKTSAAAGAVMAAGSLKAANLTAAPEGKKVPVCIFSKHLQWLDYDGMAEAAAEAGFDGVALTVRPGGHVQPERAADDLPRAVEAVKKAGLCVPMMTSGITDPNDSVTEQVLKTASENNRPDFSEVKHRLQRVRDHETAFHETAVKLAD